MIYYECEIVLCVKAASRISVSLDKLENAIERLYMAHIAGMGAAAEETSLMKDAI